MASFDFEAFRLRLIQTAFNLKAKVSAPIIQGSPNIQASILFKDDQTELHYHFLGGSIFENRTSFIR